jgi:alkylhydroperoxidase family enzyme
VTRYDAVIAQLRNVSQSDRPAPEPMRPYFEKVRQHAYKVTNADVEKLKRDGFSEDAIFEHTVSAAVAAGLARLEAGLRVLR